MSDSGTDGVVELTLEVRDECCTFVDASSETACTIVGERAIQRTDGPTLAFFSVSGTPSAGALPPL